MKQANTYEARVTELVSTGNYDLSAMAKFYKKCIKTMERQNAAVQANPLKYRGWSVVDPEFYANQQLNQYKHTFLIRVERPLN